MIQPLNKTISTSLAVLLSFTLASCQSNKLQEESEGVQRLGEANGIRWGIATMRESDVNYTNFGTGGHSYSMAMPGKTGYFYGKYDEAMRKTVAFANVVDQSSCTQGSPEINPGYQGFNSLKELTDVSSLTFQEVKVVEFGVPASSCYTGLLVFQQGKFYGVIEPLAVVNGNNLKVRWWVMPTDNGIDFVFSLMFTAWPCILSVILRYFVL
ncbi:MAG: hypothetical protein F6K24_42785 [Okeania sp. SIO2D1]|nr:hypothetical protein [Okeania sp. SIO2D1]